MWISFLISALGRDFLAPSLFLHSPWVYIYVVLRRFLQRVRLSPYFFVHRGIWWFLFGKIVTASQNPSRENSENQKGRVRLPYRSITWVRHYSWWSSPVLSDSLDWSSQTLEGSYGEVDFEGSQYRDSRNLREIVSYFHEHIRGSLFSKSREVGEKEGFNYQNPRVRRAHEYHPISFHEWDWI